ELIKINGYRRRHQANPLKLDLNLCRHAQEWANHLASIGYLSHRQGNRYGENLFWSTPLQSAADAWYSEVERANYGNYMGVGHFTQLVWKNSQRIGFGISRSNSGYYVVADFDPPGNVMGYYANNVSL
ncbi:hypothetical protein FO519_009728, partial [Halicephalobus sp. NKZ332]